MPTENPLTEPQPLSECLEAPRYRGTLEDEYAIYVTAAKGLGWTVLTFEEWLNR